MDSILFDLSLDTIREFTEVNPFVIVDFWSEECTICKTIIPELEKFALDNLGVCVFAKFKVDIGREIVSNRFGIKGVPVFIAFVDGVEMERTVGFYGNKTLNWMKKMINIANYMS